MVRTIGVVMLALLISRPLLRTDFRGSTETLWFAFSAGGMFV